MPDFAWSPNRIDSLHSVLDHSFLSSSLSLHMVLQPSLFKVRWRPPVTGSVHLHAFLFPFWISPRTGWDPICLGVPHHRIASSIIPPLRLRGRARGRAWSDRKIPPVKPIDEEKQGENDGRHSRHIYATTKLTENETASKGSCGQMPTRLDI